MNMCYKGPDFDASQKPLTRVITHHHSFWGITHTLVFVSVDKEVKQCLCIERGSIILPRKRKQSITKIDAN